MGARTQTYTLGSSRNSISLSSYHLLGEVVAGVAVEVIAKVEVMAEVEMAEVEMAEVEMEKVEETQKGLGGEGGHWRLP